MGAVGAANNLGAIIGPAGGGLLAGITLLTPLWTASVVALITAGFVYYLLPESPSAESNRQEIETSKLSYFDPRIFQYIVVGVSMFVGTAIVQQTLPFRLQDTLNLSSQETAQTFGMAMGCRPRVLWPASFCSCKDFLCRPLPGCLCLYLSS